MPSQQGLAFRTAWPGGPPSETIGALVSAVNKAMSAVRYTKALAFGRLRGYQVADTPHFDPESLEYFQSRVVSGRLYMEYGSGGSTVFAARAGARVISVETDRHYLQSVSKQVAATAPDTHTDLIHADIGLTREWGRPVLTRPTAHRVAAWERYLEAPWASSELADRQPDVVLVDGRFRVAAALTCLKHLGADSRSEILFDDYVDRPHYRAVENLMPVAKTVGRMAIFKPVSIAPGDLSRAIDEFKADWR
jgi:hypothetical protein